MKQFEARLRAAKQVLKEKGFKSFIELRVSEQMYSQMRGTDDLLDVGNMTWELIGVIVDERLLDSDFVFIPEGF